MFAVASSILEEKMKVGVLFTLFESGSNTPAPVRPCVVQAAIEAR